MYFGRGNPGPLEILGDSLGIAVVTPDPNSFSGRTRFQVFSGHYGRFLTSLLY